MLRNLVCGILGVCIGYVGDGYVVCCGVLVVVYEFVEFVYLVWIVLRFVVGVDFVCDEYCFVLDFCGIYFE